MKEEAAQNQGTLTITGSTVSGNKTSIGGGIYNHFGGRITITNSTITNNTAPSGRGTGVASFGNTATRTEVRSSVISANPGTDVDLFVFNGISTNSFDCKGYNLIGDANATAEFDQTGDQSGVLTLRATTSNPALVPNSNISFSGTGSIRTLKVTALSGSIGTATLALRVSDPSKATGTVALTLKAGGNSKDTLAGTSRQQSSSRSVSPESRRCLRPEELLRPRTSPPAASRARGLPPDSTS